MKEFLAYSSLGVILLYSLSQITGRIAKWFNWHFWYRNFYLKSLWWKFTRWRKKFWMGVTLGVVRCEKCGSQKYLQIHHIHYHSLGRERLSDLQVICSACHRKGGGRI